MAAIYNEIPDLNNKISEVINQMCSSQACLKCSGEQCELMQINKMSFFIRHDKTYIPSIGLDQLIGTLREKKLKRYDKDLLSRLFSLVSLKCNQCSSHELKKKNCPHNLTLFVLSYMLSLDNKMLDLADDILTEKSFQARCQWIETVKPGASKPICNSFKKLLI